MSIGSAVWGIKLQVFSALLIIGMTCSDFLTMHNMFLDLDLHTEMDLFGFESLPISEPIVFAATCAILLEGLPTFMGIAATLSSDKTKYKSNDKVNAKWGLWIALGALLLTFALVMFMRWLLITQNGGWKAFKSESLFYGGDEDSNSQFIAHIYLLCLPILTSALAFVASWTAFRSEKKDQFEKRIAKLHRKYLRLQSDYLDTLYQCDNAVTSLWTSLAVNDRIPKDIDTFRKACFEKIRSTLIDNCIIEYPALVERYDAAVCVQLRSYIERMAAMTQIPTDISELVLTDLLSEYDDTIEKDIDKWSFDKAQKSLEEELKKVLNNAVVVAQYNSGKQSYHLEGDRY